MCTISFVPLSIASGEFVLTSNRDEAIERKTLLPDYYTENGTKLLYPRDTVAGGTWIGVSEHKRLICLMNGGFEKHLRKPPYQKSRGVVVKDLLSEIPFLKEFREYDLNQTEPFTCIVVDWQEDLELHQLVWDGKGKHTKKLPLQNYIWASSFLYAPEMRKERQRKFRIFETGKKLSPQNLMDYHSSEGDDGHDGLIIDKGFLKTCSITQVVKTSAETKMLYKDLLKENKPVHEIVMGFQAF